MDIPRKIEPLLRERAAEMPVVTIYGPRQAGKTTLARRTFPGHSYANLELPQVRALAREDPESFFRAFPAPAIIDEVQRVPDLLSHIQARVDESGGCGRYILTGSHQPILRSAVSQSLAGRTALLTLWPLSLSELEAAGMAQKDAERAILRGFLPRLHAAGLAPGRLYEDYYRTYVERDVNLLVQVGNRIAFETFVRLLAARVGQLVDSASMAGEIGVSAPTVRKWLSVLEASYVVFRLPPWHGNFGKRFVKTPKVYFTDTGLAAHLLRLRTPQQAERDPLFGGLFENLVVSEALKWKANTGHGGDFYFVRDANGVEADLVLDEGRTLHLMEAKASRTPDASMARNLRLLGKALPVRSSAVVYRGEPFPLAGGGDFVPFNRLSGHLDSLAAEASDGFAVRPADGTAK